MNMHRGSSTQRTYSRTDGARRKIGPRPDKRTPGLWVLALASLLSACAGLGGDLQIPPEKVAAYVSEELELADKAYFRIGAEEIEPELVGLEDDGLLFGFGDGVLFLGFDLNSERPDGVVGLQFGHAVKEGDEETFEAKRVFSPRRLVLREVDDSFRIQGELREESGGDGITVDLLFNEAFFGAGNSTLRVEGSSAYLNGDLGTRTYRQLEELIRDQPEVDTLVFEEVPGSVNDAINVHTGRLLRKAGLATRIEADGMAASGGVDLFLAGRDRQVAPEARLGVHAWCCVRSKPADRISREHRAHDPLLAYSAEMLGDLGRGFYFFTLAAAPFDGVHWMSEDEIRRWRVATEWIEKSSSPETP